MFDGEINVLKTCFDIEIKLSNFDIDSREVYLISSLNSTHNQIVNNNNNSNDLFEYELQGCICISKIEKIL
jgi:hypothetical protein